MAKIRRLNIKEFKSVSFFSEPGEQLEYFSSLGGLGYGWILDPKPNEGPFYGTQDFDGVARTSALLARIQSETLDIGNQNPLNPLNLAQYFPVVEDIGWVEIGRSVASIYFEDCSKIETEDIKNQGLIVPGYLPVSKDYFDLDALEIPQIGDSIPIVLGEEFGVFGKALLQVISVYNPRAGLGPNDMVSFGPSPLLNPGYVPPIQPGMKFGGEYIKSVITKDGISLIPGTGGGFADLPTLKADIQPIDVQIVYRWEIETPDNPVYNGTDTDTSENGILYDDGKRKRWGKSRRVIANAFPADITGPFQGIGNAEMWETGRNNKTTGDCVEYPDRATFRGPEIETDTGGPMLPGEDFIDWTIEPDPKITVKDVGFCEGCPPLDQIPINYPPLDVVRSDEFINKYVSFSNIIDQKFSEYQQNPSEDNSNLLRFFSRFLNANSDIREPREQLLDTKSSPAGYFHILFNKKTCSFDVFPAFRDKDGDIPEPIGATVAYYMEDIRREITERFYLPIEDNILKTLGTGSDGYMRYSDGKSYKELLGESVLGCGDYFSFDKIPEVFVELYPVNERQEIKDYRKIIERPTILPQFLAPERHHDQNYISDIVKDLTAGIPDLDMVTDITRPDRANMSSWNDYNISGRVLIHPSRWKSMIRPIYEMIWENPKDFDDPRWLDLVEYAGVMTFTPVNKPTWKDPTVLGDYELRRKKRGEGKIIYDKIDDAISNRIYFDTNDETTTQRRTTSMFDYFQIGRLYHRFADSLNQPVENWRSENIVDLLRASEETIDLIKDFVKNPSINLRNIAADVAGSVSAQIVTYIISGIYSAISYDFNRSNPDRNSFSPLRIFKKGGLILRSKSGGYFHDKEPCPIIFLGFNDSKKIKANISELSKDDVVDTHYFNSSNRYYANAARTKRIHSMPSMKKRVKEYGINPLLDIFYLNIAEKNKENPGISPFRPGLDNNQTKKSDWPSFSKGQYPYMFPPLWNEPSNVPNSPNINDLGMKDGAQWGDIAWRNRKTNTIIPLKDRWSLSLETDDYGESYAVLTDKTPILDIYNMLMEMHVKGVSWGEIMKYVNRAKESITGGKYNEQIDLNQLEDIYLQLIARLEGINSDVRSKILEEESTSISINPIDWGVIDFKEKDNPILTADVVFKSPNTNKKVYINEIFIESDDVNGVRDTYGNLASDLFEVLIAGYDSEVKKVSADPMMRVDSIESFIGKNIPLNQNQLYKFGVKFKGTTSNLSVQPMFEYFANLIVRGNLDSPDGESFESSTFLNAVVSTDRRINITDPLYHEPIQIQNEIDFDFVEESSSKLQFISYLNKSDTDVVKNLSIKLENFQVYVRDKNNKVRQVTTKKSDLGSNDDFFKVSNFSSTEIPPVKTIGDETSYEFQITFEPDLDLIYSFGTDENIFYVVELVFNYDHGNSGKSNYVNKSIRIPVYGYTTKK